MEWLSLFLTVALPTLGMMGADRFRGAGGTYFLKCDWYASIFFGVFMAILVEWSESALVILMFILTYKLGESWGWGSPLGDYLMERTPDNWTQEEWQKGPLAKNLELALLFRGAMWGTPIAIATYLLEEDEILTGIIFASFTLSFLIAPYLANKFIEPEDRWGWQEEVRGGLQMLPIATYLVYMWWY